jgi:hypothetical protein
MKVAAGTIASTQIGLGTAQWMAPELFDLEDDSDDPDATKAKESPRPTTHSDVYALGMVFFEVKFLTWHIFTPS